VKKSSGGEEHVVGVISSVEVKKKRESTKRHDWGKKPTEEKQHELNENNETRRWW